MTWEAYAISPIDFGWELLPTIEEVASQLAKRAAENLVQGYDSQSIEISKFLNDFKQARLIAEKKGWEGDYRFGYEPRVFWLPDEYAFSYGFVWKQDNKGYTFVISPRPLEWLTT